MVDVILWPHDVVPVGNHPLVHLFGAVEGTVTVADDVLVAKSEYPI